MRWKESTPPPSSQLLQGIHPLVAQALARRGITTPETGRAFLDPEFYFPAPAMDLPGMSAAANRIEQAVRSRERICVWGDFDVDGQTSTTVLVQTLRELGADVVFHIPVRERESHGVNVPVLKEMIDEGARIFLTCDTGISANEAAEYARDCRVDMVITDHHDLPEMLPKVTAIVNPKMMMPDHPLATLSGVGVAFKLAEELIGRFPSASFKSDDLLDLVALGLVADVAALKKDARYLVQKGLQALRTTGRLGLQVMMEMAELAPASLTEEHIGFVLGPRLNALGRLGDANPSVELLTTTDSARARVLATQLENYNAQRQLLCNQVTQAAEAQLKANPGLLDNPVIVLGHPAWPGGVVGIVASRLVERYHKPAILFSIPENEPARGSARSIEGINITEAIAAQKDLLHNFGGHPMAAGLSLDKEKLPEFNRRLCRTVEEIIGEAGIEEAELGIDAWLDFSEITPDLAAAIEQLAPFGHGNEKLILASHNLNIKSTAAIGRNKEHLKLQVVDQSGNTQTILWWNGGAETQPAGIIDLAYSVRTTDWRGNNQVQIEFADFQEIQSNLIEVRNGKPEIIDFRSVKDPLKLLADFNRDPSTMIWSEAEAKKEVGGKDRNELGPGNNLVIWTIPPSPRELEDALQTVKPKILTLVCAHPFLEITDAFMARLIGLLKYAMTHHEGKTTYAELAAGSAQRLATVEVGLNWLVTSGKITLVRQDKDDLWVAPGKTINDLGGAARLRMEVQALLAESAAYRAHFKRAAKETLLPKTDYN